MPSVLVADAEVHYSVDGSGPGLMLVHGTASSGETNFGHLVDRFAADRTVVMPDYSGSGETTDGGGDLTVEGLADQVAGAARAAVTGPVDVLGFSLGAVVAAATAAREPGLVGRLVLLAGWPHGDDARHRLTFGLWRDVLRADPDLFARLALHQALSPSYLSALGDEGVAFALGAVQGGPGVARQVDLDLRADLTALLPSITAPTLVIGLTRDQIVPVERARLLHEAIPGSRYAELDSGHLALFERPDELVDLVRGFLR
ncbi:alpha/beta fold hydrolase [Actinomadura sp. HBU206391]|uniref:alpha/beta fold hydrolase n=1 Tax=Actinomadura sp. HBU206391 TaxID=2731692 RepID=UPI00164F5113|nr:alpha/beta hydrolase [Actinomadura sp. HBU206391]MBC6458486.1 alpha/beta hydrolase [Actinomadura sp. HBU206391]